MVLDPLARAAQSNLVDQLVGYGGDGFVLHPRQIKILDPLRRLFVAIATRQVVVEILAASAHPSNVQRKMRLDLHPASIDIIANHDADGRRDIKVRKRLSVGSSREALFKPLTPHARAVRREKHRKPAVCNLCGKRDVPGPNRRNINRNAWSQRMDNQLERLAKPRSAADRYVVILAVMLERALALQDFAQDLDVLTGSGQQLAVYDSV